MDIRPRSACRGGILALAVVLCAALAGCSSSTGDSAAPSSGAATTPTAGPGGGGRGIDPALRQKIDACLQAAGLPVPGPGARPTGEPPADGQGGAAPPAGAAPPSGVGGRVRGLGGVLANPRDRAALAACGITLPTRAPGAGGPPTA